MELTKLMRRSRLAKRERLSKQMDGSCHRREEEREIKTINCNELFLYDREFLHPCVPSSGE
jgi:hypothetical protein